MHIDQWPTKIHHDYFLFSCLFEIFFPLLHRNFSIKILIQYDIYYSQIVWTWMFT